MTARSVTKVLRSRLLMPISLVSRASARVNSASSCTSASTSMPRSCAAARKLARRSVVDGSHDDEDAVCAPRPRLEHLVGVEHEVLAQRRQARRLACSGQEFGPPLKRGRVGQHGKTGGAACLIGAGERRRIEIGADQSLRRARLLDLGDKRKFGRERAARRWRRRRAAPARQLRLWRAAHPQGRRPWRLRPRAACNP